MSGEIAVFPGKTFKPTDLVTHEDLNAILKQLTLQLRAGAVTSRELADGSIPADKVSADFSAQLGVADGAVSTAKLVDGSVNTNKLADDAVTHSKASPDLIHGMTKLPVTIATDDEFILYRMVDGKLYRISAADILPPGSVVQVKTAEYRTYTNNIAYIPQDNTKPQITEGLEIMSVTLTPSSVTSKLVIYASVYGATQNGRRIHVAAFDTSKADALAAVDDQNTYQDMATSVPLIASYVPGTTSPVTISIRVGPDIGYNLWINGDAGSARMGGAGVCSLVVQEIKG